MVEMINGVTGTRMWVAEDRLPKYLAMGHKVATNEVKKASETKEVKEAPKKEPIKEAKDEMPVRRSGRPPRAKR